MVPFLISDDQGETVNGNLQNERDQCSALHDWHPIEWASASRQVQKKREQLEATDLPTVYDVAVNSSYVERLRTASRLMTADER